MLAEAADLEMYPLEDGMTVAEFLENGGTPLKAIRRRCIDCSVGSKAEVRDCRHITCDLHPFRFGKNPNRKMSPEQRAIAAARLKANIRRGEDAASADFQKILDSRSEIGRPGLSRLTYARLRRLARKRRKGPLTEP
jgi:hypothetical protein